MSALNFDYERVQATPWTVNDQKRLISVDGLFSRSLEYHNNVHCAHEPVVFPAEEESGEIFHSKMEAIEVCYYISGSDKAFSSPISIAFRDVGEYFLNINLDKMEKGETLLWINIKDLRVLSLIHRIFNMHDLCVKSFRDLRGHSSILPTFNGTMLTICTCLMDQNQARMRKLFLYAGHGFLISFEQELMPDVVSHTVMPELASKKSALITQSWVATERTQEGWVPRESSFKKRHSFADGIISYVQDHICDAMSIISIKELGIMGLVHMIALEALHCQDGLLEFFSRSFVYLSYKVSKTYLQHEEVLNLYRAISILTSAMSRMHSLLIESSDCFQRLVQPFSQLRSMMQGVVKDKHIGCIYHMLECYDFTQICLQNTVHESDIVTHTLHEMLKKRQGNTATVLSLVATVFLPITFFTAMYGMNFQVDGGMTMGMLDAWYGVYVFYAMCFTSAVCCIVYFSYQGWISPPNIFCCFKR